MTGSERIARLIQLDPTETGSGFDAPKSARMAQCFETIYGRAEQERRNADRAYRNRRIVRAFCAACGAVIAAMLTGVLVLHLMAVTAANLAAPVVAPW